MPFFVTAKIYRHPDDAISLRDIWMIGDREMNKAAEVASGYLENDLADLHREVAWLMQAMIEFMDLINVTHPDRGQWQHKNYLYFEAISALREATVGILNGLPRASAGLLRSVLELFVFHCWWQTQISRTGSSIKFYDWLEGRRQKRMPRFKNVVRDNFKFLAIPADAEAMKQIEHTYGRLCSYVHAPLLEESVTTLAQGNYGHVSVRILKHCLVLARDALRVALEQLVHLYPQSLFPVDITKKFGFNPPVGMYFDQFNFVPLKAVFDAAQIEVYQVRVQDHDVVQAARQYYESQPDLTREQILETWDDNIYKGKITGDSATNDPIHLWFLAKVQHRATLWVLSYTESLRPNW